MAIYSGYSGVREYATKLDDEALARQRQVVTDTGAAQARMERMKQAEIRRRMPEAEALPDTTQIQYAAPAAAGGQGGAGQTQGGTVGAYVPRRTPTAPPSAGSGADSNAIMVTEANRRLQSARRNAPTREQVDQASLARVPAAAADVFTAPITAGRNALGGLASGAQNVAGTVINAVAGRKVLDTNKSYGDASLTPYSDRYVTPTFEAAARPAAEEQRLKQLQARETPAAPTTTGSPPVPGAPNQYDKPTPYDPIITQAATQNGIDPVMFKRLIGSESSFSPTAASPRGESFGYGIAQIAAVHGLSKEQMANPAVALPFAAKLLSSYIQQAGGDVREGVMRYKGAVSEAGRSAMGQVYDSKIAGGAPQTAAPGVPQAAAPQAPATPIARVIASGGFTPEQLSNMAMQQSRMAQFKMQQIQQLAQVTSDPAELGKMQDAYATLQDAVREAHFANLYSQGKLSDAQYAQISAQERARAHAAAAERYKAVTKAEGEIAVEDAKGANARVLEQQKAIAAVVAAGGKPENAKVEFSPDGRTTFVTYGRQVFQVKPGVATKFGPGESELVPIAVAQ